jgi:hypothetical protein
MEAFEEMGAFEFTNGFHTKYKKGENPSVCSDYE